MAKFMCTHTIPPGKFSADQLRKFAQAAQQDPTVKGYRSFANLAEGKAVCIMEAPAKDAVAAWFAKVGNPRNSAVKTVIMIFIKFYTPTLRWAAAKYAFRPTAWMEWVARHTDIAWTWAPEAAPEAVRIILDEAVSKAIQAEAHDQGQAGSEADRRCAEILKLIAQQL